MNRQEVINLGCSDSEDEQLEEASSIRVTRSSAIRNSRRKLQDKCRSDVIVIEDTNEVPEKKKKTIILEDGLDITIDDESDEEIEQTIRAVWCENGEVVRFNLKPSENVRSIFEHFAKTHSLPINNVKIRNGDDVVSMYDTVQSLRLRVTQVLEAYEVKENQFESCRNNATGKIELKCLLKNLKKPIVFYLHPEKNLSRLLPELAEEAGSQIDSLVFKFDGEKVDPSETPTSLGLEGGECLEVHIKS